MKNRRSIGFVVLVGGLLAACGGPAVRPSDEASDDPSVGAAATPASTGTFVSLSDIHFNPFYDPALFAELMATEASEWKRVFESSALTEIAPKGSDSNFNLLSSALRAAHDATPDPDFVVYSGDFLTHGFLKRFEDAVGKLGSEDVPTDRDCRSSENLPVQCFIDRTVELVSLMLRESFGEAPIYPVLGNNDSYCGDYQINPVGPFVERAAATWSRTLIDPANRESFNATFSDGGHYVVAPPASGGRIIALNTVLFSHHYENACATSPHSPTVQLPWLRAQLEEAERAGEGVLILSHIPVGTDVYATLHNGSVSGVDSVDSVDDVVGFWKPEYPPAFLDVIAPHGATIRGIFAGHTHMDLFILVPRADSGTVTFEHITPGISPLFGNNPAFEVVTYDRDEFAVLDYTTYSLPVAGAATGESLSWQEEYRFSEAYSVPRMSVSTLNNLWPRLKAAGTARARFEQYFAAGNEAATSFTDKNRAAYWCGLGTVTAADFVACVAGR
jgi:sphingomyelin phosphodiesterase acid-like 3